ncbi:MAG: hypothetical protein HOV94_18180, partial [Saccharothrix sp.]|nr:hypothetical protein [Saccharothrix sp.]
RRRRDAADKQRRLERAVAAIRPAATRLLDGGVSAVRFRAMVAFWRVRHRLTSLIAEPGGVMTARVNPSMEVGGVNPRRITAAELSALLTPVFTEAEEEYDRRLAAAPTANAQQEFDWYGVGREGWATNRPHSLGGLNRFQQARIMGGTAPASAFQWAAQDVSVFTANLPSWRAGQVGKVNWIGAYRGMAAQLYTQGEAVGISQADIRRVLSTGSTADIGGLRDLMTTGTPEEQRKFLSRMRRTSFLMHSTESARQPGIATSTAISSTLLGSGHADLDDVLHGRLAPMAPTGAQNAGGETARALPDGARSTRYPTDQALAERVRHRRVGAIIMTLLQTATRPNIVVSGSGHDLHPLANAIREWLQTRLNRHRTPEELAAASATLRAELLAFLASYHGRSG